MPASAYWWWKTSLSIGCSSILSEAGFEVLEGQDHAEAITVLKSDEQIDVLLTDVRMLGRMNGFELAEIAKRRRPELRVIATSGYSARGDLPSGKVPTQRVFGIRSREPSETGGCLNGHQSSRALCQSASAPGM
jgi:CheY-like chemotaxis protein